jgi:hypothetical protein
MSKSTGTTRLTWRWVVAGVVAFVLVAGGVVAAVIASDDSDPEVAVQDVSADEEPFSPFAAFGSIFGGVTGGIEDTVGSDLATWFLSSIGLGGTDPISGELQALLQAVEQLDKDLQQIEGEIAQLDCDQTKTALNPYISDITNWYGQYQTWVEDGADGSAPPAANVAKWATEVMDPSSGVSDAVQNIQNGAVSGGGANGTIAACLISAGESTNPGITQYLPGTTLGDTAYYANIVQPIVAYYLNLSAMALTVYGEAQHYLGWQAAGSPTGTPQDVIPAMCTNTTPSSSTTTSTSGPSTTTTTTVAPSSTTSSSSPTSSFAPSSVAGGGTEPPSFYCLDPQNYLGSTMEPLVLSLFEEGGAPYDSDLVVLANGTNYILPRSLEDYTTQEGLGPANCPVDSNGAFQQTCGPTVGTYAEPLPASTYTSYTTVGGTWVAAPEAVFKGALAGYNALSSSDATTAGEWLCYGVASSTNPTGDCTGIENASPKVVFFPEATHTNDWGEMICFMDGSIARNQSPQPFCSKDAPNPLMNKSNTKGCANGDDSYIPDHEWTSDLESSQTDNQGFYFARGSINKAGDWCQTPGWAASSGYATFRWPALDTTQLQCTADSDTGQPRSHTNAAGVPSMCGEDFDVFIAQFTGGLG